MQRISVRHHTPNGFITEVISGTERNVECRSKTRRMLGTLKPIRESKVEESTSPEIRPFKNLFLKNRLRSAKGAKPRIDAL